MVREASAGETRRVSAALARTTRAEEGDGGKHGLTRCCPPFFQPPHFKRAAGGASAQKASSLRQSLRGRSSRHDGAAGASGGSGGSSNRRPASLYLADSSSSSRCSKSRQSLRREWGSQRDLSREKRHAAAAPQHPPSAQQPQHQQQRSCDAGSDQEPDTAWSSTWTLPDSTTGSVPLPPKQRSPRKLTKDSGYETSGGGGAHGEPDYVNREWVSRAPSPPPTSGQTSGTASGPPSIGPTSPVGAGGST
ncbi:hypothetical protein HPB50_025813 [Hyalomma asiaticum]|uniref:Uncharacterized protein n=1 Tax=Hyalomma asiaticum TaxID=266040 RepID=A0ACB7SSX6_HYAAI|nr:hypothetical protein HPB50_025813 [Hyalomma asiaticum]